MNNNLTLQLILKKWDFAWLLARCCHKLLYSWLASFHHNTEKAFTPLITFLRFIAHQKRWRLSRKCWIKAERIGLSCNDVVFNIAIDAKAFAVINDILNKNPPKFINLRIRGISINTVGQCFDSADLRYSRSQFRWTKKYRQHTNGKKYNQVTRILKTTCRARMSFIVSRTKLFNMLRLERCFPNH